MSQQEKINLRKEIQSKIRYDKFRRQFQFLQLVLCQNQTIKAAAARSKVNFATAKLVLKNFRQFGHIKYSHQDYEKQIDLLKEIASIKSKIKKEKTMQREQEFKSLCDKIKLIEPFLRKKKFENEKEINTQLKLCYDELQYQKKIQFDLVTSVLQEQIKLMKSNSI